MIKILEPDEEEKIDYIYKLFGKYDDELGFVPKPLIREEAIKGRVLYIEEDKIASACIFSLRKDKIIVIYDIVTDKEYRGKGHAKEIIKFLSRNHLVELKCPIDNQSNEFYKKIGFKLKQTVKGRKRDLNIWVGYKIGDKV